MNRHKGKYPRGIAAVYRDKEYIDFFPHEIVFVAVFFLSIISLSIVISLLSFTCFPKNLLG